LGNTARFVCGLGVVVGKVPQVVKVALKAMLEAVNASLFG
jgi:hypothetical protein